MSRSSQRLAEAVKNLRAEQKKIAKSRDYLRELEAEIAQIADDCDEAEENLERAIDALSRLQ